MANGGKPDRQYGGMGAELFGVAFETWSAIGSLATGGGFLLAGIGAAIATRQLWYSKQARIDQSRPYVVVSFEQGLTLFNSVDIRVRNVGAGPARGVRIVVDPPLQRANEVEDMPLAKTRYFNEEISMMPPGYELRTYFDTMTERENVDVPHKYSFVVSYNDGHGHSWTETTDQDLEILNDLLFTETYNIHHAAKALREVAQLLKKSPLIKGQVEATTESRSDRTDRRQREHEAQKENIAEFKARRAAAQEESASD